VSPPELDGAVHSKLNELELQNSKREKGSESCHFNKIFIVNLIETCQWSSQQDKLH
jgi:hypothetical protein